MNDVYEILHLILEVEGKLQGIYRYQDIRLLNELLQMLVDSTDDVQKRLQEEYGEQYIALSYLARHKELLVQMSELAEQQNEELFVRCIQEAESYIEHSEKIMRRTDLSDVSGQYSSIILRPKYADEIGETAKYQLDKKVAIVIQGPIVYEDEFTLETVRIYNKIFPNCDIIVSTWEQERDYVSKLEEAGAVVCFSSPPEHSGYGNCSLQRVSTVRGIERAMQMGAEYICKTRADERLYKVDVFVYLNALLDTFPMRIDTIQKERLITVSPFTMSHRLYNCSDLVTYGRSEDVMRYYASPYDERDNEHVLYQDPVQFGKLRFGEAWFTSHYIESLGFSLKWTLEDSDYYRNNLFIIVDADMIDLYWPKYNELEFGHKYDGENKHEVSFLEWLHAQNQ